MARSSIDVAASSIHLDRARALLDSSSKVTNGLSIAKAPEDFEKKIKELVDGEEVFGAALAMKETPIGVRKEVEAQISFLRKLKFDYTERYAMDKYIKTIVDDEATFVTIDDNEALRKSNEVKKARLKQAKEKLREREAAIAQLSERVQDKYTAVNSASSEMNALVSQILDARHALVRLRAAHPLSSRLTENAANAILDSQVEQMALLTETQSMNAKAASVATQRLSEATRELERLRMERAKKEDEVRQMRVDKEEDEKTVVKMIDCLQGSLAVHMSLFQLRSHKSNAENELDLVYAVSSKRDSPTFTLTLLFHPNTRMLASASVVSDDERISGLDLDDLIASRIQANDVPGLVSGVMARVRNVTGP